MFKSDHELLAIPILILLLIFMCCSFGVGKDTALSGNSVNNISIQEYIQATPFSTPSPSHRAIATLEMATRIARITEAGIQQKPQPHMTVVGW
ncbi:TPA: hypothetical protein ENS27_16285 [bacterium]|nr:hypothetical protein [bacterium]